MHSSLPERLKFCPSKKDFFDELCETCAKSHQLHHFLYKGREAGSRGPATCFLDWNNRLSSTGSSEELAGSMPNIRNYLLHTTQWNDLVCLLSGRKGTCVAWRQPRWDSG